MRGDDHQRLRQAFIEGAEEDSRRRPGRGLTAEELERGPVALPRRRGGAPRASRRRDAHRATVGRYSGRRRSPEERDG